MASGDERKRKRPRRREEDAAVQRRGRRALSDYRALLDELAATRKSPFFRPADTAPFLKAVLRLLKTYEDVAGEEAPLRCKMSYLHAVESSYAALVEAGETTAGVLELLEDARAEVDDDPWMREHAILKGVIEKSRGQRFDEAEERARALRDVEKERLLLSFLRLHPFSLPAVFLLPPLHPGAPFPPVPPPPPSTGGARRLGEAMDALFAVFNETVFSNLLPPLPVELVATEGSSSSSTTLPAPATTRVVLGETRAIVREERLLHTREEHRVAVEPVAIRLAADVLGRDWVSWRDTLLHEMCHYWILLLCYRMGDRRLPDDDHGPEWQAVACHAMSVYPDADLRATSWSEKIPCWRFDDPNRFLKIRQRVLAPNPAATAVLAAAASSSTAD